MGVSQNSFHWYISMHLLYDFAELNSPFVSVPQVSLLTYSINIDCECLKCLAKTQHIMACVGSFLLRPVLVLYERLFMEVQITFVADICWILGQPLPGATCWDLGHVKPKIYC